MDFGQALAALRAEEPDRDHILISNGIDRALHQMLSRRIPVYQAASRCTVFLTTYGGDPHAAFRVARCLRHYYEHVRLAIPSYCKSAGTLIAIAADELAIGDMGELGPLDLQVTKPEDVAERGSGLDYMQGLQVALTHAQQAFGVFMEVKRGGLRLPMKQAADLATNMAAGVAAPLYAQIDPNRIGEMQRAIEIAKEYGIRLDEYTHNLQTDALDKMVAAYPSHSFVIDRKEAKKLFKRVHPMTATEVQLVDTLWHVFVGQADLVHVCEPGDLPGAQNAEAAPANPAANDAADGAPAAAAGADEVGGVE